MPFTSQMDEYYKKIIKPVVEECGITPVIANDIYNTSVIA